MINISFNYPNYIENSILKRFNTLFNAFYG